MQNLQKPGRNVDFVQVFVDFAILYDFQIKRSPSIFVKKYRKEVR